MTVQIRDMTIEDCDAVASIRVRGWQYAYAGLMPQSYLDAMDTAEMAVKVRGWLSTAGPSRVTHLVAERAGDVVGWACLGPCRDEGTTSQQGEIYALYAHPEVVSTGVGRALMAELTTRAHDQGLHELLLWVVEGNDRARRFYARAGFEPDGLEEPFEMAGVQIPELRYRRALRAITYS
ncbi:GNAT family N-acetyltransferase [Streptomyces sp. NBC_00690]|uniref:GNAT family N-acetyltransferase n=1 Tax=Streptomyces sp. NBC_00690 TaxID=2975808 RepID=UPI002E2C954F|nr:GNAT family N-acetyltransferase [Streptomyces sp. NBC_00690]